MTRGLTPEASAAIALPVTLPGYFVEILFSTPVRFSSRGTISWNGATWTTWQILVRGFAVDVSESSQSGTITLGDTDGTLTSLVLNEGVADRAINVWKFYGDEPGATDPIQIFGGVGNDCGIDADNGVVNIGVRPPAGVTLYCPRRYITQEAGWSILPPDGWVCEWAGQTFRLTREGN